MLERTGERTKQFRKTCSCHRRCGHVGGNLVRSLLAQGRRVRALVREHTAGIDGLPVEVVRCDVTDAQACRRALAGAPIVYHLAARISVGWDPPGPVEA